MAKKSKNNSGKLFVVCAPSGAGKTTLVNNFLSKHKEILQKVVTYTTRSARVGEKHAQDYYFIAEAEFKHKVQEGFFIEWSQAYGHFYGSAWQSIAERERGQSYIIITDIQGAQALKQLVSNTIVIWVSPASIEQLQERLLARGTESEQDIAKRLALSEVECAQQQCENIGDYCIINDCFEQAAQQFENLIYTELQVNKKR